MTKQLETELALIEELDYGGYFLTMWEIVCFCRSEGILCQGRGSAANSVVCYCLGITAVDPIRLDLLFELAQPLVTPRQQLPALGPVLPGGAPSQDPGRVGRLVRPRHESPAE